MARHHRAAALSLALSVAAVTGCGSTSTPQPSSPAGSLAASPAVASTATPAPSSTPAPQTAAIARFVALVTRDGFGYEATFSGDDRHSASILKISKGLLQVRGDDVRVRATFTDGTGSTVVEHRYVGGKGWLRFASFVPWERMPMTPAKTMAAFAAIRSAKDVTFVEPVTSDGRKLYRIRFASAILNPALVPYVNLSDETVRKGTMTLLIDAEGRPVRGTADINATGRVSGQLQEIVIELSVTFTKVGAKIAIPAP